MKLQLENFSQALQLATKTAMTLEIPTNWLKAFMMLNTYIATLPTDKPAVIFFDEFPWIETRKSGFLQAFDHWWNASASKKPHLKIVICGSAASWMIDKIINSKGGSITESRKRSDCCRLRLVKPSCICETKVLRLMNTAYCSYIWP